MSSYNPNLVTVWHASSNTRYNGDIVHPIHGIATGIQVQIEVTVIVSSARTAWRARVTGSSWSRISGAAAMPANHDGKRTFLRVDTPASSSAVRSIVQGRLERILQSLSNSICASHNLPARPCWCPALQLIHPSCSCRSTPALRGFLDNQRAMGAIIGTCAPTNASRTSTGDTGDRVLDTRCHRGFAPLEFCWT